MRKSNQKTSFRSQSYSKKRKRRALFMVIFAVIFLPTVVLLSKVGYDKYMDISYPREYQTFVERYASQNGLEEEFVYAVIKCESGFDPNAVSPIGARGLMQLTEDTFDWVKYRMNDPREESTTYSDLFDPETNIKYGTYLLGILMEDFAQNQVNVLCGYHAGRAQTFSWLSDPDYSLDGETIQYIPFSDTRAYVERVEKVKQIYHDLYYA